MNAADRIAKLEKNLAAQRARLDNPSLLGDLWDACCSYLRWWLLIG